MTQRHLRVATPDDANQPPIAPDPTGALIRQIFTVLGVNERFRSYGGPITVGTMTCRRCNRNAQVADTRLERHRSDSDDACVPAYHPWFRQALAVLIPWCSACGDDRPERFGCYHVDRLGAVDAVMFQVTLAQQDGYTV